MNLYPIIQQFWQRSGTTLSPLTAGDNILTTGTIGGGAITGTSFIIGANTLTTSEWAFLDGTDQSILTTSTPRFARLGIGDAASTSLILNGLGVVGGVGLQGTGVTIITGAGGTNDGATGGAGGDYTFITEVGGNVTGIATGGRGGDFIFTAGAGGAGTTAGRNGAMFLVPVIGNVGIGISVAAFPTARLHLGAGTAVAGTAMLKFSDGVVLTTPELGAWGFDDPNLYFTITDTTVKRKGIVMDDGTTLTATRIPVAGTNGRLVDYAGFTSDGTNLTCLGSYKFGSLTIPAVISASGANILLTGLNQAYGKAGLNIDTDTIWDLGPIISGRTSNDGGHRIYFEGFTIWRDDQIVVFGNSADSQLLWNTSADNDILNLQITTGSAADSGIFSLTDRITYPSDPGVGGPYSYPVFRINAASSTSAKYIQFYHDSTNGVIDVGSGLLSVTSALTVTGLITATGGISLPAAANIALATTTGTKIGVATNQLLGFYNATPVNQPDTIADPTGGLVTDAEARTAINSIIDRLQELGLIA